MDLEKSNSNSLLRDGSEQKEIRSVWVGWQDR